MMCASPTSRPSMALGSRRCGRCGSGRTQRASAGPRASGQAAQEGVRRPCLPTSRTECQPWNCSARGTSVRPARHARTGAAEDAQHSTAIPLLGIKCALPLSPTRTSYVLIKLLLLTASSASAKDEPLRSGAFCVGKVGRISECVYRVDIEILLPEARRGLRCPGTRASRLGGSSSGGDSDDVETGPAGDAPAPWRKR